MSHTLNDDLQSLCAAGGVRDFEEVKRLLLAGADVNLCDSAGRSIFIDFLCYFWDADIFCAEDYPADLYDFLDFLRFLISAGWNTKKFAFSLIRNLVFNADIRAAFDATLILLDQPLDDNAAEYSATLNAIGTEESYQRCCDKDHALENIFYAMYEAVLAKEENRDPRTIAPFYNSIDKKIDNIVLFSATDTTSARGNHITFDADIGFICGERLLVLRRDINILFMDDRRHAVPQTCITHRFPREIIGSQISDISFNHREICKGSYRYGQPTITLHLSCGRAICFTHNFGEVPKGEMQSFFYII